MTQLLDENGVVTQEQEQPETVEVPKEISVVEKSFDQMTDEERSGFLVDWENKMIIEEQARFSGDADHLANMNASSDDIATHVVAVSDFDNAVRKAQDESVTFMQAVMNGQQPAAEESSGVEKVLTGELIDPPQSQEPLGVMIEPDIIDGEKVSDAAAEFINQKVEIPVESVKTPITPEAPTAPEPATKKEFIPGVREIRKKVGEFVAEKINSKIDPKRVEKINKKLEGLKEKALKNSSELGLYQKQSTEIDTKIKALEEKASSKKSTSAEAKKIKQEIDNLLFQKTNIGQQIATETLNGSQVTAKLEKIKGKHDILTQRFNERIEKQTQKYNAAEAIKNETQVRLEEYKTLLGKYSKELQDLTNNPRVAQKNKERITQLKRFIENETSFIASTPAKMVAINEKLATHKQFIKDLENQRDNIHIEDAAPVVPEVEQVATPVAAVSPVEKTTEVEPTITVVKKSENAFADQVFAVATEGVTEAKAEKPKEEKPKEIVPEPEEEIVDKNIEQQEPTENKLESSEGYKNTLGEYVDKWNLFIDKNNKKGKRKDGHLLELNINAYTLKTFNEMHEVQLKTDSKIGAGDFEKYMRHIVRNDKDKKPKDEAEAKSLTKLISDFKTELKK